MGEIKLPTCLSSEDISKIKTGDIVYFSGPLFTMRDQAHLKALELLRRGECLPFNLLNGVIYHCGPLVKGSIVLSAGPTTSMRMEKSEAELIKLTGLRAIIGKGGMGPRTLEALKACGAAYLEYPGGVGALAAKAIRKVKGFYWPELGDPEAVWVLEVNSFGPCIVTMDSSGNLLRTNI